MVACPRGEGRATRLDGRGGGDGLGGANGVDEAGVVAGAFYEHLRYAEFGEATDVDAVVGAGEDDDREVLPLRIAADVFEEADAVHDGHHQVENDEVGLEVAEAIECGKAVHGARDFVPEQPQQSRQRLEAVRRVIDDENCAHSRGTVMT